MAKYSITWGYDSPQEMLGFLERNKDLLVDGGTAATAKKAAGRPAKAKADDEDLGGTDADEDLLGADDDEVQEEPVTLESIRQMISAKVLDGEKKKKIKVLLTKFGVESAAKIPAAKYKDFFEKLKAI